MAWRILSMLDATSRDRSRIEKALRSGDTECVRTEREIPAVLDLIKTQEFELRSNAYRAMKNFAEAYPPISDTVGSALAGALVYPNASSKDIHDILSLLSILATKPERLGGFSPGFKIRENAEFVLNLLNSSKSWRIEQNATDAGHPLSALAKIGTRNSIDTLRKFATKAKKSSLPGPDSKNAVILTSPNWITSRIVCVTKFWQRKISARQSSCGLADRARSAVKLPVWGAIFRWTGFGSDFMVRCSLSCQPDK